MIENPFARPAHWNDATIWLANQLAREHSRRISQELFEPEAQGGYGLREKLSVLKIPYIMLYLMSAT